MAAEPRMRIVFFGTPEFAVPTLGALLGGPDLVVGVVCQPDRPAGRGQHLHAPPVKELAVRHSLPMFQPEKLRRDEVIEVLKGWSPDLAVVAAYGRILPPSLLELPRLGCINVHASLLPKYRGAAPIQWAILRGETITGVTIMRMNERMDEGSILLQRDLRIGEGETYGELQKRLAQLGAAVLMAALERLHQASLEEREQDDAAATLAPMIQKQDGRIDWTLAAEEIVRRVRAFNPWPSAFTTCDGKLLKIHRARAESGGERADAATVVGAGDAIRVAAGAGVVAIEELQLEGRKRLSAREFGRGGVLGVGARLGEASRS